MDDHSPQAQRRQENEEDRNFTPTAVTWLLSLDKAYFPSELAKAFPRIVNRLAEFWDNPFEGGKYLDSLLVDERGGRQGFPMPVLRELIALRELKNLSEPEKADVWDKAHLVRYKPPG